MYFSAFIRICINNELQKSFPGIYSLPLCDSVSCSHAFVIRAEFFRCVFGRLSSFKRGHFQAMRPASRCTASCPVLHVHVRRGCSPFFPPPLSRTLSLFSLCPVCLWLVQNVPALLFRLIHLHQALPAGTMKR